MISVFNIFHRFLIISVLLVGLSACSSEDVAGLLGFKIDANNAPDVARAALDMAEAANLAEDVTDAMVGTGPTVNETVNCNDPLIGATGASGTATITGTIGSGSKNLTITYNNCTMNGYALNGSFTVASTTVTTANGDIQTDNISGNLAVDYSGQSFSISNYSMVSVRNKTTEDYSEDFGMTLSIPLLGDVNIDTTVPFLGNKLNSPDKPTAGELVVSSNSSMLKLTAIDNVTGYNLDLDSDGNAVYETQVTNPSDSTLIFPW